MIIRNVLILAATCAVCTVAAATDLPVRKPGLWEVTMHMGDAKMPPHTQRICLDAATNQLLYRVGVGASQKMCNKTDINTVGGKVVVDSVCDFGGTKATGHSVTTMMGDTAYHTDVTTHYDPPMFGKSDSTQTLDAKWAGACPADMRAGDIVMDGPANMPSHMRMNLNDMFKDSK